MMYNVNFKGNCPGGKNLGGDCPGGKFEEVQTLRGQLSRWAIGIPKRKLETKSKLSIDLENVSS